MTTSDRAVLIVAPFSIAAAVLATVTSAINHNGWAAWWAGLAAGYATLWWLEMLHASSR